MQILVDQLVGILTKFIKEVKAGYIYPTIKHQIILYQYQQYRNQIIKPGVLLEMDHVRMVNISVNDGIINRKYIDIRLNNFYGYCSFLQMQNGCGF